MFLPNREKEQMVQKGALFESKLDDMEALSSNNPWDPRTKSHRTKGDGAQMLDTHRRR